MNTAEILLVAPSGEHSPLLERLTPIRDSLLSARSLAEAMIALADRPSTRLVLTTTTLPDGNWLGVLREMVAAGSTAELVVITPSRIRDFRDRALALGVFDVLREPWGVETIEQTLARASSRAERPGVRERQAAAGEGAAG